MIPKEIIEKNSKSYSEIFNFDLKKDPFPMFLLSVLLGARISENIAIKTFNIFINKKILTPEKIIETGWDNLVKILDYGGYTRYDFKTASKLIEMSENIIKMGGLKSIHNNSKDFDDLIKNLKSLASGIGDITIGIFLREMVGIWEKARPYPSEYVKIAINNLNVNFSEYKEISYAKIEYFLMKVGKNCIKNACENCVVKNYCIKFKK